MPGNDLNGGFASHILIPTRFLVPVDRMPEGHELPHLAVIADAVTTPYQALLRAEVSEGDSVVVVGTGGVGIFGVQIAAAFGAKVLAVDIARSRVDQALAHGATAGVCTEGMEGPDAKKAVKEAAKQAGFARQGWKVFEMSGSAAGQQLAFSLLNHTGKVGIVGFTMDKVNVRLSNLMAFDADTFGSWGCSPRHYKPVLDLINEGKVQVKPFVTFHPLAEVNSILEQARHGQLSTRPVLVP
jgi:6-hydroxycyclohex-1-ene-1-carbonyl-CoA dehydrogenase